MRVNEIELVGYVTEEIRQENCKMCRQYTRTASTEDLGALSWTCCSKSSIARSAITEDMGEHSHGSRPLDIQSLWR